MSSLQQSFADHLLGPMLPQLLDVFTKILLMPDGPTVDSGLRTRIVGASRNIAESYPKLVSKTCE